MLKDIMVYMDQAASCQNRLEAAIALAKQHGATLTGLSVYSSPRLKDPARQVAEMRDMFHRQTAEKGLVTDWLDVDLGYSHTGIAEMIGYYTSFTDLLVVSQPLPADKDKKHEAIASPERLLLGCGRPVLFVPRFGSFPRVGERVMVAWKAGPKASRAMNDAMPLLQAAKYVNMVSVDTATFSPEESQRLCRYLNMHQVAAKVELIPPGDLSVGDTLLNLGSDDSIDLMVLGVHIMTRRGKLDMGAIGSYLLGQMTVPMLLSH